MLTMDGRENQNSYILGNHAGGRIVVPPRRQQDQASYAIPTTPLVQQTPLKTTTGHIQAQPSNVGQTTSPGAPYNQRHQPTSAPTPVTNTTIESNPTISFSSTPTDKPSPESSSKPATPATQTPQNLAGQPKAGLTEAQRRYHQAWQNYYQKYYQNYYIAALQEQQARFAKQQAEVVDSREPDGKLSQTEVQERIQSDIIDKVKSGADKAKKHWWFWPTIIAIIVILIFLFLQYNSVIAAKIASFVSPGSSSTQTIIVGTGVNQPVSDSPRIIIPKINVNAPVTYGLTSLDENTVQTALQNGPINYPVAGASALPGQRGNTVILGHSSADVFAPGNYKFIFVQLNRLTAGDLFYLDYGTTRYTYKVTETKIINPTDVGALNLGTDKPYATLVTCDPPGTIANRLLVIAEQVSPNPNDATETQSTDNDSPTTITGKPKTLLESIFGS